ncbi:MAG TPA: GAF domain-containing protein [Alphaproteobacteria bacterium]|nr:GAF domain-containing protein [Alphaproteobacteria bacterium]
MSGEARSSVRSTARPQRPALSVRQYMVLLALIVGLPFAGMALVVAGRDMLQAVVVAELAIAAVCGILVTAVARRFAIGGRALQEAATAIAAERRVMAKPTGVREYDQALAAFASASLLLRLRADERSRAEQTLARHSGEQTLLYQFADKLYRATSRRELYDAAIETIRSTLRCNRASISLLDETGKSRFVAWEGLSERYRTAVDGQSPWTSDDPAPRPVSYDYIGFADVPASLIADVTNEGIFALAFAPVLARGKLAGKFVAYYDAPHRFTQAELDLAVILARQLSLALDRLSAG